MRRRKVLIPLDHLTVPKVWSNLFHLGCTQKIYSSLLEVFCRYFTSVVTDNIVDVSCIHDGWRTLPASIGYI